MRISKIIGAIIARSTGDERLVPNAIADMKRYGEEDQRMLIVMERKLWAIFG